MDRKSLKTILLASIGSGLELYDFLVFVVFASGISHAFFPEESKFASLLGALSIFAVGYLARPLGGFLFGSWGDKKGRKKTFSLTIQLMAISTILMAICPSYSQIGWLAPLLFTGLRILQGFSIGGELPGAITFIGEHGIKRLGLACAILFFFLNIGLLLANFIFYLLSHLLHSEQLLNYGWRIAFLFGGIIGLISYLIRRYLHETSIFKNIKVKAVSPIKELVRKHRFKLLLGLSCAALSSGFVTLFLLYLSPFMTEVLGYSAKTTGNYVFYQTLLFSFISPLMSLLGDFIKRWYLLILGSIALLFLPVWFIHALIHHQFILLAMTANLLAASIISGIFPGFLVELFPANVRYSGIAACYNIAFALIGGLSPLVVTWLSLHLHWLYAPATILQMLALLFLTITVLSIYLPRLSSNAKKFS